MTQYNTLNIELSNSQLNKLKSGIENGTEVTLSPSSNVIGDSNDNTNFSHKLFLIDTHVSNIRKAFANGSSANIKFSKTQFSKMVQLGGFGSFLFLRALLNPLDTARKMRKIGEKIIGSGITLTSNEIKDIMKEISSSENRAILLKGTIKQFISQKGVLLNFIRF